MTMYITTRPSEPIDKPRAGSASAELRMLLIVLVPRDA